MAGPAHFNHHRARVGRRASGLAAARLVTGPRQRLPARFGNRSQRRAAFDRSPSESRRSRSSRSRSQILLRGRRINENAEIKSFIRKSNHRTSVWGHPNLLGYIEVGDIVRPIITRDDFDRGKGRTVLYDAILTLEDEIRDAINQINEE